MKYATATAFRTALESRLLARASNDNIPVIRLRKLVAFDRLIARLMAVAPDRWVLKGAVALQFRAGPEYRTTRDIDFGHRSDEEVATSDLLAAQTIDLDDHFSFVIEREESIDPGEANPPVRYHARAELAGRTYESFVIDVVFRERTDVPEVVAGPDLLGFAGIVPARLPVVALENHVAEKVHAYVRAYSGGRHSSRVKDLVDLALIESLFSMQAGRLADAFRSTFSERDSRPPHRLPPPPKEWRLPYRKLAGGAGLEQEITQGYARVATFIDPVLGGDVDRAAIWDPASHLWRRPG